MVIDMAMVHKFSLLDDEALEIEIHEDIIFPNLEKFLTVDTFWGSFDKNPSKGLDYCGYTYIPPTSLDALLKAVKGSAGLEELEKLCSEAKKENQYIIHCGI